MYVRIMYNANQATLAAIRNKPYYRIINRLILGNSPKVTRYHVILDLHLKTERQAVSLT